MRITFRIIFSILVVISILVLLFTFLQVSQEKKRLVLDLERRASLLGESFKETVEPLVEKGQIHRLQMIVEKFGRRERFAGLAIYDTSDKLVAATPQLSSDLASPPPLRRSCHELG